MGVVVACVWYALGVGLRIEVLTECLIHGIGSVVLSPASRSSLSEQSFFSSKHKDGRYHKPVMQSTYLHNYLNMWGVHD